MNNYCLTCQYKERHRDENTGGGCAICIHNPVLMDFYEEDMKRCPFCGELASLVQSDDKCRIECTNCKATTILYNNKKEAIFSWNRRV